MTDPEFGEVFTTYLGRASPGVRPYAGETVAHVGGQAGPNGRLVVDEFGMNLNLANIPGTGNWTPPHNVLATHIFGLTVEAGFHTEVTPAHYFSSLVPVGVLLAQGGTPGIVPDESTCPCPRRPHGGALGARRGAVKRPGGTSSTLRRFTAAVTLPSTFARARDKSRRAQRV